MFGIQTLRALFAYKNSIRTQNILVTLTANTLSVQPSKKSDICLKILLAVEFRVYSTLMTVPVQVCIIAKFKTCMKSITALKFR